MRVRYSFGSRHTGRIANIKKQRGKYPDIMKDVVRISDIVLEILDARYIDEMRNEAVEADVIKKGKQIIYVLNKIDLVDRQALDLPKDMKPVVFISATKGEGINNLKGRIKMEAKRILKVAEEEEVVEEDKSKSKIKKKNLDLIKKVRSGRRVHVGVIGYPNAGKSSVINAITRRGVAKTAKQAGFTKGMQKIRMSDGILILDTPGVIADSEYSSEVGSFAKDVKVGARTYSDVKYPEDMVAYLICAPEPKDAENATAAEKRAIKEAEVNAENIDLFYGVAARGDVDKLIEELGRAKGFLGKGGVVDIDRTARLVLRDWQEGRIASGNSSKQ